MENFDDLFVNQENQQPDRAPGEFDKEAWAAKKQQERADLFARIDAYAMEMTGQGEGVYVSPFQTYLDVQARFDRYSVNNAILVADQMPEATKLADYDTWKASGVYVKKGEDHISILEPGKEYEKDDGSTGVSYNVKKVFDISQVRTKQRPAPTVVRDDRLLLKALIASAPCKVAISAELPENVNVKYDPQSRAIYVRQGLDAPTIFRGLSQEVARARIDKGNYECASPAFAAYAISYMLCKRSGVTVEGYSFDRQPEQYGSMASQALRDELGVMREVAGDMTADMNRTFEKTNKTRDSGAR